MCGTGKISIIVPTHIGRRLVNLIASVKASTYKNWELIIVDEGLERSAHRNIGIQRASGDYYLFLDSDMTIHPKLLEDCLYHCKNGCDGLYIPEIIVNHPIKTWFRSCYTGSRVDAIRFVKKDFCEIFDEQLTGVEDWDWDKRFLGDKGVTEYPLYHHTDGHSFRKKLYYAKWTIPYIARFPDALKYELNPFYRLRLIWKKLWS